MCLTLNFLWPENVRNANWLVQWRPHGLLHWHKRLAAQRIHGVTSITIKAINRLFGCLVVVAVSSFACARHSGRDVCALKPREWSVPALTARVSYIFEFVLWPEWITIADQSKQKLSTQTTAFAPMPSANLTLMCRLMISMLSCFQCYYIFLCAYFCSG